MFTRLSYHYTTTFHRTTSTTRAQRLLPPTTNQTHAQHEKAIAHHVLLPKAHKQPQHTTYLAISPPLITT